jgi:hypothetical protein
VAVIRLSSRCDVAGMDGNRTHPGRLSSAPQTVLKTAGLSSASVHRSPQEFGYEPAHFIFVHPHPPSSAYLAVTLAVIDPHGRGDSTDRLRED